MTRQPLKPHPTPKKPSSGPKGGKAKRSRSQRSAITVSAQALAAHVYAKAEDKEAAAAVAADLPEIMQAVLDGAKVAGSAGRADRDLVVRLLQVPGFKGTGGPAGTRHAQTHQLTDRLERALALAASGGLGRGDRPTLEGERVVEAQASGPPPAQPRLPPPAPAPRPAPIQRPLPPPPRHKDATAAQAARVKLPF